METTLAGKLYVVASPSGGGKTSLVNALLERFEYLKLSISYTTRPARPGEEDGVNYHFVDESTFQEMVGDNTFLEYATVYGYHYGTSHPWVLKQLQKGVDVILEIDWQGARQIRQMFPSTISIFIIPPSRETLLERLQSRKQDSPEVIAARMQEADSEMQHSLEFDYLVINDQFGKALEDLVHIVHAERLRCDHQRITKASLLADLVKNQ